MAVFGGISVGLYLAAFVLTPGNAPNSDSPGVRIVHWASLHRTQLLASQLCFALALVVFMVFAAGLYHIIRRGEGQDGWLAMASLASVVVGAGIFGAGTALFMVVAYRPATDPAVVRALWDGGWLAYNSSGFAFGAWIAIVATAALTHRVLPLWTAWIGAPLALISLVGPLAVRRGPVRSLRKAGLLWSSASVSLCGYWPSRWRHGVRPGSSEESRPATDRAPSALNLRRARARAQIGTLQGRPAPVSARSPPW